LEAVLERLFLYRLQVPQVQQSYGLRCGIKTLRTPKSRYIRLIPCLTFVFKDLLSGIKKGKTVFYPKFLNGA
jgi:hypothetical protein